MFSFTIFLVTCGFVSAFNFTEEKENKGERRGKAFSLFSVVQFPNEGCVTNSATYDNGTCYTASECSSAGGSASGNCAAGFGVCCVFSVSASGSTISQNNSYIVNPDYPANYAPTATPAVLTYTINKCSTDICRVRLDFETHVLTAPSAADATSGQCVPESMTIATTGQPTVPSAGVLGFYPWLCGTNTGYHAYIDLSETADDTATITFNLNDAVTNEWKMKVSQFSCDEDWVSAQAGCFQYFTGITGTIQSYNLAGTTQIATHAWTGCIRQEEGHCCIQWTQSFWEVDPTACVAAATTCAGDANCDYEYVQIPGGQATTTGAPTGQNSRFCGVVLNVGGFAPAAINTPVISCTLPFTISHATGVTATQGAGAATTAPEGFQLTYSQLAAGC